MSDLRDALGAWANDRGEEVASSVRVHQGATRAAAGRRRARNLTLAAAAAVVGLVAASGIAMAGPWKSTEPAAEGDPVGVDALVCGAPWTLDEGTITHDPSAPAYFGGVSGGWVKHTDGGDVIENPDSVSAGYESLAWEGVPLLNGNVIVEAIVVAVKDGLIVGSIAPDASAYAAFDGAALSASGAYPGRCGDEVSTEPSGTYTYHAVIAASLAGEPGRPLQTIVDPSEPITVEVTGLEEWSQAFRSAPADLRAPVGDSYQAFVVDKPAPGSCTPYTDLIDSGIPSATSLMYDVTIPGVQALTGDIWGKAPAVVIDDEGYDNWYVGLPTGITAQTVEGGNPLGSLEWTTGTTWGENEPPGQLRLINTPDAQYLVEFDAACFFTQPIPALDGAVFLIIDGVDAARLSDLYPTDDFSLEGAQTWVYLGQAG